MPKKSSPPSKRRYAGKPARERHAERYQQFIDAGIRVIGTQGYQSTSVKAVCQEAGLTERYFYQCFNNREALLAAVYEHLNEELRARTIRAMEEVPREPRAMARASAEVYFQMLYEDPQAARILLFEAVGVSSTMLRLNRAAEAHAVELIRSTARRPDGTSHLEGERGELIAAGLVGASVNIGQRWVLDEYRQSFEEVVESLVIISDALTIYLEQVSTPENQTP